MARIGSLERLSDRGCDHHLVFADNGDMTLVRVEQDGSVFAQAYSTRTAEGRQIRAHFEKGINRKRTSWQEV
jgi:hypothetical protein